MNKLLRQVLLCLVLGIGAGLGFGLVQEMTPALSQAGKAIAADHQKSVEKSQAEKALKSNSPPPGTQLQTTEASTEPPAPKEGKEEEFDFFSDAPVTSQDIVEIPPEKSKWVTVGGPAALIGFGLLILWINKLLIPFERHTVDINLRNFPTAAKRGMALAVVLFGIAFAMGASEIWYQMQFFGSSAEFIDSMSLGKLIVMTHAHLFGFTTAFFIVGIPFSMHFNHIRFYQWIFPIGLAASLVDVMSWWGIKYIDHSFEVVSMVCALFFSGSYLFMLIGLLRVLAFPDVIWASDKDRALRIEMIRRKRAAKREFRKFFS